MVLLSLIMAFEWEPGYGATLVRLSRGKGVLAEMLVTSKAFTTLTCPVSPPLLTSVRMAR